MPESFATRLNDYLSAAYPILAVETHEEMRVVSEIRSVVANRTWRKEEPPKRSGGQPTYVTIPVSYAEWDSVSGMIKIPLVQSAGAEVQAVNGSKEPPLALNLIKTFQEPTVVVMKDIHPFIEVPSVWRTLRNIIGSIKESGVTIIFISPRLKIAAEIAKEVQVVEYRMPSRDELALAFRNYIETNIAPKPGYEDLIVDPVITEAVAEAAMGMTSAEADNAFALATIASARKTKKVKFDRDFVRGIFEEKIANLKNSALEYKATNAGFESVGGLEAVKAWSMRRRQGFSEEARRLRLPYPKGVLMAGIKGCGKTTVAQAIAHQFGFPLFMLDIGKLFASKVGETEALTRETIRLMESLGRAVVLIDELEKSLGSSATSGGGDSGTSSRMFGTLVSWMSLKTCPVFIIGTLNNFEVLPSELIRKGRFDEVWWVDLPTSEERMAIFNALLQHKFKLTSFKVEEASDPLIEATRDFSGAEIEAVIEEALYGLLEDPKADIAKLLMSAAKNITPQAQIDPSSVERLREKAKSFKPASITDVKPIALAPRGKRKVSLGE